ncbi:putative amino acid transporter [Trypanosoma cruzi]|uniref:Putative amino acid transporter n=1 Tax=Trypanosoma cruzi TaxID=5693 RepID=A0A2V2UJA8_TRYCR|nr:putative amino acid transporter [Trypanosoma cruzi]
MHWRWHPRTSLRRQQQWPRFGACVSGPHWGSHRLLAVLPRGADGATWLEDVRRHGTCAAGSRLRLCHCRATLSEHLWGSVSFIISVGDIFKAILDNTSAPAYWKSKSGNRLLTSLLWLTVMLPLVIPRHINSLRHISAVGIVFVIYFVVMIIIHSGMHGLSENAKNLHVTGITTDEGIHLFGTGNRALDGLGVFMFAFCVIQLVRGVLGHVRSQCEPLHSVLRHRNASVLHRIRLNGSVRLP